MIKTRIWCTSERAEDVRHHLVNNWGSQSVRQADGTWLDAPSTRADLGKRVAAAWDAS